VRVAVWSPLPPAPTGIADYTAELLPALARHHEVIAVVEDPATVDGGAVPGGVTVVGAREAPVADLDLYQVGNSAAHVFVYRAALERPGVVVLHEWVLHDLVWREAMDSRDSSRYLREMRRSHGEAGSYVGRQVTRGLGGSLLPALFAANDRLLERSLGAVALTREAAARLAKRHPGLPHLVLPQHHAGGFDSPVSKARARADLGLSAGEPIVTAPGFATPSKRIQSLVRAIGRLRRELPSLRLVLAGEVDPDLPLAGWAEEAGIGDGLVLTGRLPLEDLVAHLMAADVVSALRFPSRGEMSAVLVRAMGAGRPVLVTAGTPAAEEMPPGTVVPVAPGPRETLELESLLRRLLADESLRAAIGAEARRHVLEGHALGETASALAGFLVEVHPHREARLQEIDADRAHDGSLTAYFFEEVRQAARELGLERRQLGLEPLLKPLDRPRPAPGVGR
jgi:glycosyltransferase involved in cell wall biosynthesis